MTRQVSFKDEPTVVPVDSLTPVEVQQRWYSADDLKVMRSSAATSDCKREQSIRQQQQQQQQQPQSQDEQRLSRGTTAIRQRKPTCAKFLDRRSFVMAVLEQQNEHQRMGIKDPKGLFQFSRAASKQSRLNAIRVAKEDAKDAQDYINFSRERTLDIIDSVLDLVNGDGN